MYKYIKEVTMEKECIICLDECNDKKIFFCKVCKQEYHHKCFITWMKKSSDKCSKCSKCLYCLNTNVLYKKKKFLCWYFDVKV